VINIGNTLKGFHNGVMSEGHDIRGAATLSGLIGPLASLTQGALPSFATLGWVVKPFQGRTITALPETGPIATTGF
jgi:hypothetical protein